MESNSFLDVKEQAFFNLDRPAGGGGGEGRGQILPSSGFSLNIF